MFVLPKDAVISLGRLPTHEEIEDVLVPWQEGLSETAAPGPDLGSKWPKKIV